MADTPDSPTPLTIVFIFVYNFRDNVSVHKYYNLIRILINFSVDLFTDIFICISLLFTDSVLGSQWNTNVHTYFFNDTYLLSLQKHCSINLLTVPENVHYYSKKQHACVTLDNQYTR